MRYVALALILAAVTAAGCSEPAAPPATSASTPAGAVAPVTPGEPAPAIAAPVASAAPVTSGSPAASPSPAGSSPAPAVAPTPGAASAPSVATPAPAPPAAVAAAAPPAPVYREVTIPSGTRLSIEVRTSVASDTSQVEDRVAGVLLRAVAVDGAEVLPAGTALRGAVTDAQRSARVKGRARLAVRFTSLTFDDEELRVTSAPIVREAEGTKKEDAAKIGIGAGAGAVIGAIAGGRKGAVTGGAIGAGAGTGVVLATRGDEVSIPSGTTVTTTLSAPLVVRVRVP